MIPCPPCDLLPALAGAALVFLAGPIAREVGGGIFAQALAALCVLAAPGILAIEVFRRRDPGDAASVAGLWFKAVFSKPRIDPDATITLRMVSDGYYYAAGLLAGAAAVTYLAGWPYAAPFYILALFCLNFFRDPERQAPEGPFAVAPADGKVISIQADESGRQRISIFMNVFDVHVNRTPIPGKIVCIHYQRGRFLAADKEEASQENEQNTITVEGVVGGRRTQVTFKQIAGLIARRIICYKRVGDVLGPAERVGLIKFGSRVDVWFGPEWEIAVKMGERVSAGSSVLARILPEA